MEAEDKILYVGRNNDSSPSEFQILRAKYYKCDSSMFHNEKTMDHNMYTMLDEYKVLDKGLLNGWSIDIYE